MPRNPDHRGATREEFERFQRGRPIMLRQIATLMQVWRWCGRKECRRARACGGLDGAQCAGNFIQGLSEEMRATFHEALRLRGAGVDAAAAWHEAGRRVAQRKAQMEAALRGEGQADPAQERVPAPFPASLL